MISRILRGQTGNRVTPLRGHVRRKRNRTLIFTTGLFYRNFVAALTADVDGVSTATWSTHTVGGHTYLYHKLFVSDVSTDSASVILQPIRFTVLERNNVTNVTPVYRFNANSFRVENSAVLPVDSHIEGGKLTSLRTINLINSTNGVGPVALNGEPATLPGRNGNLSVVDGTPWAPRKGVRPRFLKIFADGEDVTGLIDLETLYGETGIQFAAMFVSRQVIPFAEHPTEPVKLNRSFTFEQGVEYSFDVFYEVAIEPINGTGNGVTGAGKALAIIAQGWSIPDYALNAYNPYAGYGIIHAVNFNGLPVNVGFDFTRHTYDVELEFDNPADTWPWVTGEQPLKIKLENVSATTAEVQANVTMPSGTVFSNGLRITLDWNLLEIPQLFLVGRKPNGQQVSGLYRTGSADYANQSKLPDNRTVFWGSAGVWNSSGADYFYPNFPVGTNGPVNEGTLSVTNRPAGLPDRIRVTKASHTPAIQLSVRFVIAVWEVGQTLTVHFDMKNISGGLMKSCFVTSSRSMSGLVGQTRDILSGQTETITATLVVTSGDIAAGQVAFTAFATGSRNSGTRAGTPKSFSFSG